MTIIYDILTSLGREQLRFYTDQYLHYTLYNLVSKHALSLSYSIYVTSKYTYVYTQTFGYYEVH